MTTTQTETFTVRPYSPNCKVIHDAGDHAVIGISPGNSYFTHQRVIDLAEWGLTHFDQVDLIYTDLHVVDTYLAQGYSPDSAQRKMIKNLRGVRAKVNAAVETLDAGDRLRGRPMSALLPSDDYRRIRRNLDDLLTIDAEFREACDALIGTFLTSKVLNGAEPTPEQRKACLDYVCAEIPLFLDTPAIMRVPSSLNVYHQALPLADLLYSRGCGLRASRNQGHAIVRAIDTIEGPAA
ncbi:tRNA-dependent cyclodipeptide synthase [Streptomyces sp. NPDC048436]|uniref:tRNA-dependent cyclodipeptide synthase n=1 Tax=Streptomyces sp. NPDC048436 TaxID=3365550 RepID=UPI00371C20FE